MKIPSSTSTPQVISPSGQKPSSKTVKNEDSPKAKGKATQQSSSTAQRISYWFGSIGIEQETIEYPSLRPEHVARYKRLREQKQLANLQLIMSVALSVSSAEQTSEHIDPDWFHSFISMAENIYSPTMQELWGKIFAVEVQRPGSFSLRSLETLTKLTQRDASLFSKACQVACRRNNDPAPVILTGYHQQPGLFNALFGSPAGQTQLPQFGLSYSDVLALGSMKLLYATEIETGLLNKDVSMTLKFTNQTVTLQARSKQLLVSYYKFTAVGSELARLLPKQDPDPFIQHLRQVFTPHFSVE